jgi:hypothetical protein
MRAGFIATAPLVPTQAFAVETLDLYRALNKHNRRLGLQPFMKALREFHGITDLNESAYALSKAFDCYLNISRLVDTKVDEVLGRGGPDGRLTRACPACLYVLNDEPPLPYGFLCAGDGNMSLKRFKKAGATDNAVFTSTYFVSRDEVQKFADVAQARQKGSKRGGKGTGAKQEGTQGDGDLQDAEMETQETTTTNRFSNKESGEFPLEEDPFMETFGNIVSNCAERWKANSDDNKKTMWDCFDESGIFVLLCRHGHILLTCDIVQSGEQ